MFFARKCEGCFQWMAYRQILASQVVYSVGVGSECAIAVAGLVLDV